MRSGGLGSSAAAIAAIAMAVPLVATITGISPFWSCWRTLSTAPVQLDRLDAQLQTMRRLAAETSELRNMPPVSAMQSGTALLATTERLGPKAELTLSGDGATCSFDEVSAVDLQGWLTEVRSAARARVMQAQLSRGPKGYSGTIVLSLAGAP